MRKRKLKILGHEYKVTYDDNLAVEEGSLGQIEFTYNTIRISTKHTQSAQDEALLHEIVEALNHHLEWKLEHSQITQISECIYQVLETNKMLK